jgi:hypothetical protein
VAHLNVNPADLIEAAGNYTELAVLAAQISPRAVTEVTRIAQTHGLMGYPTAVGIVAGLAAHEPRLLAKAAEFGLYAQRLNEHATTYQTTDSAGGDDIAGVEIRSA